MLLVDDDPGVVRLGEHLLERLGYRVDGYTDPRAALVAFTAAPDRYAVLLTTGLTTLLVGQAALNVGVVTAAVPVTGVPLPFVSFGGSSLVSSFLAIGVLLNLSQYAHPADGHAAAAPSRPPRRRGVPARP